MCPSGFIPDPGHTTKVPFPASGSLPNRPAFPAAVLLPLGPSRPTALSAKTLHQRSTGTFWPEPPLSWLVGPKASLG
jgi:hypothetical protein